MATSVIATDALSGASKGSSGGLFGGLIGGLTGAGLGYFASQAKPVTPWYETKKGLEFLGLGTGLLLLVVLVVRKKG